MPDTVPITAETVLEVVSPDGARRYVRVTQSPFPTRMRLPSVLLRFDFGGQKLMGALRHRQSGVTISETESKRCQSQQIVGTYNP